MNDKILKTAFFGTPDFSVPTLEMLSKHPNIDLQQVICSPDRPAGRGLEIRPQPVAQFARDNKIPLFQTANINKEEDFLKQLESNKYDLFIVIAFSQFLSNRLLEIPRLGAFNIHTSLLPKFRGASPIHHAILHGESETGVSIQKMVKKMDAGDVYYQSHVAIGSDEIFSELYTRLKFLAPLSLREFLALLSAGTAKPTVQDESCVSFAPTLDKALGHLLFNTMSAQVILNKIRALNPWPSTFCFINSQRVKILKAKIIHDFSLSPGKVDISKQRLCIGCSDATLEIERICPEGKKDMSASQYITGFRNQNNLTLG